MEFFIYTVLLGFVGLNSVSFFTKKIYIFDFFFLALLIFDLLIILPSYPTYVMNFKGINFTNYFLSLLILQILLSGGFEVAYMSFGSKIKRIEKTEITIDINKYFLLASILGTIAFFYVIYGIKNFRSMEFVSFLAFRMFLWRGALPDLPLGSLFRFLSKTGTLLVFATFLVLPIEIKKRIPKLLIVFIFSAALFANILEMTKSAILKFLAPIIILMFIQSKNRRKKRKLVTIMILLTVSATILLGVLEAGGDLYTGITRKFLGRIILIPSYVSQVHFFFTNNQFFYGKTNLLIAYLLGGPSKVYGLNAQDYDNYIYKLEYKRIAGVYSTFGTLNAPFFIYGWVNFGFLGIIVESLFVIVVLIYLESLVIKEVITLPVFAILVYKIATLVTGANLWDWFFGIESVGGILLLNYVLKGLKLEKEEKHLNYLYFIYMTFVLLYYFLIFVSRKLS